MRASTNETQLKYDIQEESSRIRSIKMRLDARSSDELLLDGCRQGDRLAQRFLYERYFGKNMAVCMRYAKNRDEALEILNLGFLKVFQNLDRYQPTGSLGGWIARIIFNTAMDHIRSQKTYRATIHYPEHTEAVEPDSPLRSLELEDIYRKIHTLPETPRQVFCLYVVEGYRHRDIAELFGFDEATSRWHLSQARKKLKTLFIEENLTTDPS